MAEGLRLQAKQSVSAKEILNWRLPSSIAGCKTLLRLLSKAQAELSNLSSQIADQEAQLNACVHEMYGMTKRDQKIVGDFLLRYSSRKAVAAEDLETQAED